MNEEQFAAIMVKIWRLRIRRAIHRAYGNRRAARYANTRIKTLAGELSR